MMRGLVAQEEREGFGIVNGVGLQIDGALGEPVALGHVVDQDALGARCRLELFGEIANQLHPLAGIFAGKQDEDGSEAGEAMGAGVLTGSGQACRSTRTGAMAGRKSWIRQLRAGRPRDARVVEHLGEQRTHRLATLFLQVELAAVPGGNIILQPLRDGESFLAGDARTRVAQPVKEQRHVERCARIVRD